MIEYKGVTIDVEWLEGMDVSKIKKENIEWYISQTEKYFGTVYNPKTLEEQKHEVAELTKLLELL